MPNPQNIKPYEWKKGKPKTGGRKKGTPNVSTRMTKILQTKIPITDKKTGKTETKTILDWIIIKVFYKAINSGDWRLLEWLLKVFEGVNDAAQIEVNTNVNIEAGNITADTIIAKLKSITESIPA
jgi:hypothetical protein